MLLNNNDCYLGLLLVFAYVEQSLGCAIEDSSMSIKNYLDHRRLIFIPTPGPPGSQTNTIVPEVGYGAVAIGVPVVAITIIVTRKKLKKDTKTQST